MSVADAVICLKSGGLVLHPTDTVCGIAASVHQPKAIARMRQLKNRPAHKGFICLVSSIDMLESYSGKIADNVQAILLRITPPTTVILDTPTHLDQSIKAADGSIAFRIPKTKQCNEMIKRLGHPIISSSANFNGQPSATTIEEVDKQILAAMDYIVHPEAGAQKRNGKPSQIVSVKANGQLTIVRY